MGVGFVFSTTSIGRDHNREYEQEVAQVFHMVPFGAVRAVPNRCAASHRMVACLCDVAERCITFLLVVDRTVVTHQYFPLCVLVKRSSGLSAGQTAATNGSHVSFVIKNCSMLQRSTAESCCNTVASVKILYCQAAEAY